MMHPFRKLREAGPMTPAQVAVVLNRDVVMHTPLLIKPLVGRELVAIVIATIPARTSSKTTLLRWQGTVEGHKLESLELLTDDENGLLLERTVAYRPFPALKILRNRLMALSAGKLPDDLWDYPEATER